ncbi:Hint domain-containing protein [Frigidibacter sp. RF13]|uniref:Hint domain-containing protein n=1 Tax=Frigidibacter sp. RF13 TaxID=2997340 RepID=UPI002270FC6D|nr:Hint domain-containing protein [Frigidibacter sp. RF13]MCY1126129.1 Hint domain-containing protein [Frigidibacter sp. RF13]
MFMPSPSSFRPDAKLLLTPDLLVAAPGSARTGLRADTLVETADGWRPAGELLSGTNVPTYEGGLVPLRSVTHAAALPGGGRSLIHFPGGALDNCCDVWLKPGQRLLVTAPLIEALFDAAAVVLRADMLVGYRGIQRVQLQAPTEMVSLCFDREETIFVNSGTMIRCGSVGGADRSALYPELEPWRAADLLGLLEAESDRYAPRDIAA